MTQDGSVCSPEAARAKNRPEAGEKITQISLEVKGVKRVLRTGYCILISELGGVVGKDLLELLLYGEDVLGGGGGNEIFDLFIVDCNGVGKSDRKEGCKVETAELPKTPLGCYGILTGCHP
jgi:hypothetical protein